MDEHSLFHQVTNAIEWLSPGLFTWPQLKTKLTLSNAFNFSGEYIFLPQCLVLLQLVSDDFKSFVKVFLIENSFKHLFALVEKKKNPTNQPKCQPIDLTSNKMMIARRVFFPRSKCLITNQIREEKYLIFTGGFLKWAEYGVRSCSSPWESRKPGFVFQPPRQDYLWSWVWASGLCFTICKGEHAAGLTVLS